MFKTKINKPRSCGFQVMSLTIRPKNGLERVFRLVKASDDIYLKKFTMNVFGAI